MSRMDETSHDSAGGVGGKMSPARWALSAAIVAVLVIAGALIFTRDGDNSDDAAGNAAATEEPNEHESSTTESLASTTTKAAEDDEPNSTEVEQPGDKEEPPATQPGFALAEVDWRSLDYPVDCGGQTVGEALAYVEPVPGKNVAVVAVSCQAVAGSPPSAVLVYEHAEAADKATPSATLLEYNDNWTPLRTNASGSELTIVVSGYSSHDVAQCCPDMEVELVWAWSGDNYQLTTPQPEHARLPRPSR
ncbi:MAG: hypothetical protein WC184_04715 [Acidimicrobiia bacterium]